jgi:hypothetical protein
LNEGLPHAADKATKAAASEATEAATTASTRCMAGTPTMIGVRRREFITLRGAADAERLPTKGSIQNRNSPPAWGTSLRQTPSPEQYLIWKPV